jgi:hypothetical protein
MVANPGLTFERLCDWIDGRLSVEEANAIAMLVAQADESVQRDVAWLRAFQRVSAQTVLAAPPAETHAKLLQQFADFTTRKQSPNLLQRFVASLSFDSLLQPASAGVRSAAGNAPRQLIFTTELADIVLNIQWPESAHHAHIFGQILPTQVTLAPELFAVQLLAGIREFGITMADETGEFDFERVVPGTYQLIFSTDDLNIILPALEMQRPSR